MRKSDVKALEAVPPQFEADDRLVYEDTMVGESCHVVYSFADGRLHLGMYLFDNHDDRLDAVTFTRLRELLEAKYGSADVEFDWSHPYKRVDMPTVGDLGTAVAAGLLRVMAQWLVGDTHILLWLKDDEENYNARVNLYYADHAFQQSRPPSGSEHLL
jgi:hypothetical protein